jgi:hypothetical protein
MLAAQSARNALRNVRLFLARDFHMDSGKKYLIEAFYRSITNQTAVPIPYEQILLTSRIMDSIFSELGSGRREASARGSDELLTTHDHGQRQRLGSL